MTFHAWHPARRRWGMSSACDSGAVPVPRPVVRRRAEYAVGGEILGDREVPRARDELGEDPPDHLGGLRIDLQHVQTLPVGGIGRVGVRTRVGDAGIRTGSAAEEPSLAVGERGQRSEALRV